MMMDVEAEPLPQDTTPLDFLKLIYRSPEVPLSVRMRAAIEAAPFVHPRLSVTAMFGAGDFAEGLEKAIKRSGKVIEHQPLEPTQPLEAAPAGSRPMVSDRRFRR